MLDAAQQERRARSRSSIRMNIGLRESGSASETAIALYIAEAGCGLMSQSALPRGYSLWVELPSVEPLYSTVAWSSDGRLGVSFNRPLHPAVLRNVLAKEVSHTPWD
jgi:hypothetical protein